MPLKRTHISIDLIMRQALFCNYYVRNKFTDDKYSME